MAVTNTRPRTTEDTLMRIAWLLEQARYGYDVIGELEDLTAWIEDWLVPDREAAAWITLVRAVLSAADELQTLS